MIIQLVFIFLIFFVFFLKINTAVKLLYAFVITDFFHQIYGGVGFNFLAFSNFTFRDFLGYLSIYYALNGILKIKHIKYSASMKAIISLIILVLSYLTLLLIISFYLYGSAGIQAGRAGIYSLFFIAAIVFNYEKSINVSSIFFPIFRLMVVSTIIIYVLRITGLIDYYHGAYGLEGTYGYYRYIINVQVLYLIIYYIFISVKRQYGYKIKPIDNVLAYVSVVLILTSTQRMATVLFVLYLIYEIIFFRNKRVGIFSISLSVLLIMILPSQFVEMLEYAFLDIYEYDDSNLEGKTKDIPASLIALYNDGSIFFGRLFQEDLLERSYAGFYSRETRGVHNLFISYLYTGGLVWFFLLLSFWSLIFFRLFKLYKVAKHMLLKTTSVSFFLHALMAIVILLFAFNMSSGAASITNLILSFCIIALLNSEQIIKNKLLVKTKNE